MLSFSLISVHFFKGSSYFIKVGLCIANDAWKISKDYDVCVQPLEDLSPIANLKLGGIPKKWSLASLTETITCKQVMLTSLFVLQFKLPFYSKTFDIVNIFNKGSGYHLLLFTFLTILKNMHVSIEHNFITDITFKKLPCVALAASVTEILLYAGCNDDLCS